MNARRGVLFVLSAALFVANGVVAQGGPGRGRDPQRGGRGYDPKTVETISGEVVRVEQFRGPGKGQADRRRAGHAGVHLTLKSDAETIAVHLGPSWYLDEQSLKIAAKDRIEVQGSRVTIDGAPAIIAARVKKGDQSLRLRNDMGIPAWSGQGRSAP